MNQSIDLRLSQINAAHAERRADAAQHRLGRAARAHEGRGIRRTVDRSLIRLGNALAAEPEPSLRPASPR